MTISLHLLVSISKCSFNSPLWTLFENAICVQVRCKFQLTQCVYKVCLIKHCLLEYVKRVRVRVYICQSLKSELEITDAVLCLLLCFYYSHSAILPGANCIIIALTREIERAQNVFANTNVWWCTKSNVICGRVLVCIFKLFLARTKFNGTITHSTSCKHTHTRYPHTTYITYYYTMQYNTIHSTTWFMVCGLIFHYTLNLSNYIFIQIIYELPAYFIEKRTQSLWFNFHTTPKPNL